jgi:hypothetical protein
MKKCKWHNCQKELTGRSDKVFCSKDCRRNYNVTKSRIKQKIKAIKYKGGCCERCGCKGNPDIFDFHHRDIDSKEFKIGSGSTIAWSKVVKELEKCDLLCANCHRETHFELKPTKYIIDEILSES